MRRETFTKSDRRLGIYRSFSGETYPLHLPREETVGGRMRHEYVAGTVSGRRVPRPRGFSPCSVGWCEPVVVDWESTTPIRLDAFAFIFITNRTCTHARAHAQRTHTTHAHIRAHATPTDDLM